MDESTFQTAIAEQHVVTNEAYEKIIWSTPLSLDNKKARFPGFRQRTVQYKSGQQVVPGGLSLPSDLVMHESVPMALPDGTKLYSDIFLPGQAQSLSEAQTKPLGALVAWSPYGKQQGMIVVDDFPGRAGIPKNWLSGLEKFEGPDPAYWCEHGYAVINVDSRGAYTSEGNLRWFGHKEAQDGADFVTWVSEQPWCNGKVALTGNSWLAMLQWGIGSLRPKGLAALAPWEGLYDVYKNQTCENGIPFVGFGKSIAEGFVGQGKYEDCVKYLEQRGALMDSYWEDKRTHPERINVPTYVVGSWTNTIHTPGTFQAWNLLPDNIPKWLRVHNSHEWHDYYDANSRADLKRFFDHFLLDITDNGWEQTPPVRLSILNMGMRNIVDVINRPEASFTLARQKHVKYYLQPNSKLSSSHGQKGVVSYDSQNGKAVFEYIMPAAIETTGYFMAHLLLSTSSHDEMDIFVQVEQYSAKSRRQGTLCIKPQGMAMKLLMKFMHDWQIDLNVAGIAFNWGPNGSLRVSHASGKLEHASKVAEPFYSHIETVPLKKGQIYAVDVPMRPYGMFWEKGSILRLTIAGKAIVPFPLPGVKMHKTNNKGEHNIHFADVNSTDSSYLLVPHV